MTLPTPIVNWWDLFIDFWIILCNSSRNFMSNFRSDGFGSLVISFKNGFMMLNQLLMVDFDSRKVSFFM